MAGRSGVRGGRVAVATLVAAALLADGGLRARGAEPEEPVVLAGSMLAIVADLDGDDEREVVRISTDASGTPGTLEAWKMVDADWQAVASSAVPTPAFAGPMALIPIRVDGEERVLLGTSRVDLADEFGQPCCLELHDVTLADGKLEVRPVPSSNHATGQLMAADLDADGTDELVIYEVRFTDFEDPEGSDQAYLDVLQRTAEGWEARHSHEGRAQIGSIMIGETDGVPGDEILVGPTPSGLVERLTLTDGDIVSDYTSLGTGEDVGAVHGIDDGRILVGNPGALEVLRWPRGAAVERLARRPTPSWYFASLIGTGANAVVLTVDFSDLHRTSESRAAIMDLELRPLGEVRPSVLASRVWELIYGRSGSGTYGISRAVDPVMESVPGGWVDGRDAFIHVGVLVRPGGEGGFEATAMRTLIGSRPLGLAGPGNGWLLTGDATYVPPVSGLLMYGGLPAASPMALTPISRLLQPDEEVEAESVEFRNAVEIGRDANGTTLLAHREGFEARIVAPAGSVVAWGDGDVWESQTLTSDSMLLDVRPPTRARQENRPFERTVLVIGPDGTGTVRQWRGSFAAEAPALTVRAETQAFSLAATVSGRASEAAAVTVDGRAVEFNRFGAFRVEVDAPIWPRSVVVEATDPFGAQRTERVEIVGFLDYRGLPWIPIVGVLTVALGLLLFVRTPRHRPLQLAPDGDGRLEEIDGDLP